MRCLRAGLSVSLAACLLAGRAAGQVKIISNPREGPRVGSGAIEEDPRKVKEAARKRCAAYIEEAGQLAQQGKYGQAARLLDDARAILVDTDLVARWKTAATDLSSIGMAQLASADEAYEAKDYKKALAQYSRIAVAFVELPPSQQAYGRLRAAEGDPELKAYLNEARASAMFALVAELVAMGRAKTTAPTSSPSPSPPESARPPAAADAPVEAADIMALHDDRFVRAVGTLENIVTACSGAETASRAARLLTAMEKDPTCSARLETLRADRVVKALLGTANAYRDVGMLRRAAPIYRQLMTKFPKSPQAAEAAGELGKIQAKLGMEPEPGSR